MFHMNAQVFRFRLVFFCVLTFVVRAAAEIRTADGEVFGGAIFPVPDSLERNAVTGFGLTWPLARRTRLGVHFQYARIVSRGEVDGILPGELTLTPFLVFVRRNFALGARWSAYLAGGGGVVFARLREDAITIPEVRISQSFPCRAALHLAGGFSFNPTRKLMIFVQGGCLLFRTTATTTIRDMNFGVSEREFAADLGSLQAVGGLAFHF